MTQKFKIFILCCVLILPTSISFAARDSSVVILAGRITDPDIEKMPGGKTKVYAVVSELPFNGVLLQNAASFKSKIFEVQTRNNEPFRFELPVLAGRFYLHFGYQDALTGRTWVNDFDNVYILERGDSLQCMLRKNNMEFTGRGAAKMNCQTRMHQAKYILRERVKLFNEGKLAEIYNRQKAGIDSSTGVQLAIVNNYAKNISGEARAILLANSYGLSYFRFLQGIRMISRPDEYQAFLNSDLYRDILNFKQPGLRPEILVQAPVYADFLFERLMMLTRSFKAGHLEGNTEPAHIRAVYNRIMKEYSGIVREKLLACFFLQWGTQPTITSYLEEGLSVVRHPAYQSVLLNLRDKLATGVDFYPFALESMSGDTISLTTLKNKVLVVDFWYTGCTGCANLKQAMTGVWQTFKDDGRVVFVSISIDKNKEQWKKSVLSRMYTEPEATNLYTGGLGKNHPVIKALQIAAYPRMFIVKDGKVFSANPPWPSGQDVSKGTTREFIELIGKALKD